MAGNATDLIIRLLVEDESLDKVDQSKAKFEAWDDALGQGSKVAAVTLGGLAVGAVAAANAAADAEQSTQQLQFALSQFPATADTSAAKLMELNSQLAMKTQFDDDALASGQAILAQYNLTGLQIEQLTPLLADYAAKTGQEIPDAAESLGKAMLGQGRALKDVGIDFTDTGSLGGNYSAVLDGLTAKVEGFAESQGSTAQGSSAIFQNSLGELMETIGQGLLPVMVSATQIGADVVGWMTENADAVEVLAIGAGVLAGAVLAASAAFKGMMFIQAITTTLGILKGAQTAAAAATTVQTTAQLANNAAWYASPVTWIVAAIIVAIGLLVVAALWLWQNWGSVTQWIGDAWNWLWGNVLSPVFTAIGAVFTWIYQSIILPVVTGIMLYIGLWAALVTWLWETVVSPVLGWIGAGFVWLYENAVRPVVDWISAGINMLGIVVQLLWATYISPTLNAIGGGFNWIWANVISPVFNAIGGAVTWVGNTVRDVFGAIAGFMSNAFQSALGAVRGPVNGIIALVNSAIRSLNSLSVTIPAWVPIVGGQTWSLGIPQIPYLATGGVTTGPLLAVVGDNPGGREYIEPVDKVASRMERVAVEASRGAGGGSSTMRLAREDLEYLAEKVGKTVGETVYPLIVTGAQRQIKTALGV